MVSNRISVVIPARLESSRLPGKILLDLGGRPMLQRVWERAQKMSTASELVIATDSAEVRERAEGWGARVLMTSPDCPNGTARIASILDELTGDFIINLQGDEPFMEPELLDALAETWRTGGGDVITAVRAIADEEELFNPNVVKVALGGESRALLFSRSTIPHVRDWPREQWLERQRFWAHIGVYGYTRAALSAYLGLAPGELEQTEKLEQLRFLERGFAIRAVVTDYRPLGVDTLDDLERARARLRE